MESRETVSTTGAFTQTEIVIPGMYSYRSKAGSIQSQINRKVKNLSDYPDGKVLKISGFDDAVSALRELFSANTQKIQTVDDFTARWREWHIMEEVWTEHMSDLLTPSRIINTVTSGSREKLIRACNDSIIIARASDTHMTYFKPSMYHEGIYFSKNELRMFDDEMIQDINGNGWQKTENIYVVLNNEKSMSNAS